MTGVRKEKNGFRAWIELFRARPRPAKASPKPASASCELRRVLSSSVENTSSSSSPSVAFLSGIVAPAAKVCLLFPGVSSTYFRPSAERGRIFTVVFRASGSTVLSSFMAITATARVLSPLRTTFGVMSSTTPTRKPPTRTSLPATSLLPVGTSALRS